MRGTENLAYCIARIKKEGYLSEQNFRCLMELGVPIYNYIDEQGKGISASTIYNMVREQKINYKGIENFLLCSLKSNLSTN